MSGKLYLIPNALNEENDLKIIPFYVKDIVQSLRFFLVEEEKNARRYLKKLDAGFPLHECTFLRLNEHTPQHRIQEYFSQIAGKEAGIVSEAGCPCVADPGAEVVLSAHQRNMEVIPLVGPSAILLALMASGLNGQNFAFHGYLPKDTGERIKKIRILEKRSFSEQQTQLFMETPYRTQNFFEEILSVCEAQTFLCVACDLTAPTQLIKTQSIAAWKKQRISLGKRPALFLIQRIKI